METNISMADFYEKYQNENLELIDVREVRWNKDTKNSNLTMNTMSSVKVECVLPLPANFSAPKASPLPM